MRAIILAAGRGSRMKALTSDKPKCLVELRGRSLLERQLEALRGGGVSEIGIARLTRRLSHGQATAGGEALRKAAA